MHGFGSVNKVILDQRKFVGFRNWVSISVGVGYFFQTLKVIWNHGWRAKNDIEFSRIFIFV